MARHVPGGALTALALCLLCLLAVPTAAALSAHDDGPPMAPSEYLVATELAEDMAWVQLPSASASLPSPPSSPALLEEGSMVGTQGHDDDDDDDSASASASALASAAASAAGPVAVVHGKFTFLKARECRACVDTFLLDDGCSDITAPNKDHATYRPSALPIAKGCHHCAAKARTACGLRHSEQFLHRFRHACNTCVDDFEDLDEDGCGALKRHIEGGRVSLTVPIPEGCGGCGPQVMKHCGFRLLPHNAGIALVEQGGRASLARAERRRARVNTARLHRAGLGGAAGIAPTRSPPSFAFDPSHPILVEVGAAAGAKAGAKAGASSQAARVGLAALARAKAAAKKAASIAEDLAEAADDIEEEEERAGVDPQVGFLRVCVVRVCACVCACVWRVWGEGL